MRRKRIYRITVEDESRLSDVWSVSVSRLRLVAGALAGVLLMLAIAVGLVMTTPLRTLLPGYMKKGERAQTQATLVKLDSLRNAYEANAAFMNNIVQVLDTERMPGDSARYSARPLENPTDSFINPSREEREFVKLMEEKEKYNISILAPVETGGVRFAFPVPGGVVSDATRATERAEIYVPAGTPVLAIADGTVVDNHYSDIARSFIVSVQHRRGFLSRYTGLQRPLCQVGQHISTGEAISLPSAVSSGVRVEMWRNGEPLVPVQYIGVDNAPHVETPEESPLS